MTIAFIGTGVMGETLLTGALRAGSEPSSLIAIDARESRRTEIEQAHGVRVASEISAIKDADLVVIAVKPQDATAVLREVRPVLASGAVLMSIMAGVSISRIESELPKGTPVVRVMPNTPAQVGAGAAGVSAGSRASAEDVARVVDLMSAVGTAVVVPEKYLDAVTALSGSGPAYVFYLVESMTDAGVTLGLPRDIAASLASQTVFGSAKLLVESGEHPTILREKVTSPGGTTAAAVAQLDAHAVKAAVASAMTAARDRSIELS